MAPDGGLAGTRALVRGSMKAVWDNVRAIDVLEQLRMWTPTASASSATPRAGHNAIFAAFHGCRPWAVVSNCEFRTFQKDDLPSRTGRSTCRGSGTYVRQRPEKGPVRLP